MFKRTVMRRSINRNSIFIKNSEFFSSIRGIPKGSARRFTRNGNKKEKRPLEKKSAAQEQTRKTEREEQSEGESSGEARRPSLPKPGG